MAQDNTGKMKDDNVSMLEAVVENTELGKNTLEQMIPMAQDGEFKAELLREKLGFHEINQEAHMCLAAGGEEAKGQSSIAKMNVKMGISMKTLTDKSTRNLAEMLAEGSGQGVMDCLKSQKDYPEATPGAKKIMQKLQDFEQDNMVKLGQFL
jgi:hypothetical protein